MSLSDYKTALVTGASSGVGAACVRSLRKTGLEVLAVARRADKLAELAEETGCQALPLDLTDTDAVYAELAEREVDVLVNNAGLGRGYEGFFKSTRTEIDETIDLNVGAAIHVVRAVAAGMVTRRRGHIVHIGSIAGLYPLGFPVYGASKGALHLFAQHLRMDLKGSGVRQTEICPGRIETPFFETAFKTVEERQAFMSGFTPLQPENIADAAVFAIDTPWHVNVSLIELTPTEQVPGGAVIEAAARD